jgi:cytochrome c-type biogenesis protein CcmE
MSTPSNISGNSSDRPGSFAKTTNPSTKRKARSRAILLVASIAVVTTLVGYALSDTQSFEYYKHVDEVMRDPSAWRDKRLQLHGFVVPGSILKRIDRDHQKLEYKFRVENCGSIAEARFAGVVPDTFKEGAEVVLKGQLQSDGFHTNEVMAKCPSKYAQEGAQKSAMVTRCSREGAESPNAQGMN